MRFLRIGLIALAAVPFAAAAGSKAAAPPRTGCRAPVHGVQLALPAPLTIRTACGAFRVARAGNVERISSDSSPTPRNAAVWRDGVWDRSEHGHLAVGRGRRTLWRSAAVFRHIWEVAPVVAGPQEIAFAYGNRGSRLYVSTLDGHEHVVARNQFPLGWTSGGLYVGRNHDGAVLLRSGTRARRIVGANVRTAAYEASSRSLYFLAQGRLVRAHGARTQLVTGLGRLGLSADRSLQLQLLGRLVVLQGPRRLVVLRRDGSLLASTPLPGRRRNMLFSGQPIADHGVVAFAVLHPDHAIESQRIERGVETVYLLRPGARAAVPVHSEHMRFNVCGHGANLRWHGDWLLYSTGEGPAALIDTRGARTLDLTSLVGRLPGFSGVDETGPLYVSWG